MHFKGIRYHHDEFVRFRQHNGVHAGRIRRVFIDGTKPRPHPIRLGIEPVISYLDLPTNLKKLCAPSNKLVYLYETVTEINISQLDGHFECTWTSDSNSGFRVAGIVYEHPTTGKLCLREPHLRHRLASELQRPDPAPPGLQTLRLFLDIYFDDFGLFRNVYNVTGGVYLVLGNLPQELRQKLRNNFDLGLIPAGVSFKDYIQPFMRELEDLQRGQRWRIGNNEYWVVAGTNLFFRWSDQVHSSFSV